MPDFSTCQWHRIMINLVFSLRIDFEVTLDEHTAKYLFCLFQKGIGNAFCRLILHYQGLVSQQSMYIAKHYLKFFNILNYFKFKIILIYASVCVCACSCMHACTCTHVCMVIHVRVWHWCVPQNAYKVDFRYHFSPSTLLETGSVCCSSLHKSQASGESPVPASCLAKGALGLQQCTNTSDFTSVLKIQTRALDAYTANALPIESSAHIIVFWTDQ